MHVLMNLQVVQAVSSANTCQSDGFSAVRLIGTVGSNIIVANTLASFTLLTLFALGGVVLSQGTAHKLNNFDSMKPNFFLRFMP